MPGAGVTDTTRALPASRLPRPLEGAKPVSTEISARIVTWPMVGRGREDDVIWLFLYAKCARIVTRSFCATRTLTQRLDSCRLSLETATSTRRDGDAGTGSGSR